MNPATIYQKTPIRENQILPQDNAASYGNSNDPLSRRIPSLRFDKRLHISHNGKAATLRVDPKASYPHQNHPCESPGKTPFPIVNRLKME